MRDGSDAVADWPLLNALLNTASGATWVSIHHGGGVGMGYSQHAGVVIVCDGTPAAARRIERVLWNDPATGVMRHADAGYEIAIECAREQGLNLPFLGAAAERARLAMPDTAEAVAQRAPRHLRCSWRAHRARARCSRAARASSGWARKPSCRRRPTPREVHDLGGAWVTPGLIDCHTHLVFAGNRADEYAERLRGRSYEEIARAGGGILSSVRAVRAASEAAAVRRERAAPGGAPRRGRHDASRSSPATGSRSTMRRRCCAWRARSGAPSRSRVRTTLLAAHTLPPEYRRPRR